MQLDEIKTITEKMLGNSITIEQEISNGVNSRIFKCRSEKSMSAIKVYPKHDNRNRQRTEKKALIFLDQAGFTTTPKLVAIDERNNLSILTWIDGNAINGALSKEAVKKFSDFQLAIIHATELGKKLDIGPASEACTSIEKIINQIDQRLEKLRLVSPQENELDSFIKKFTPLKEKVYDHALSLLHQNKIEANYELPHDQQILIPSDLGAHNALISKSDNIIHFLDFEYFGWDDPVTSVCNFNLHPAQQISNWGQQYFKEQVFNACRIVDPLIDIRYEALLPLFHLRWAVIVLKCFLFDQALSQTENQKQIKMKSEKLAMAMNYLNALD